MGRNHFQTHSGGFYNSFPMAVYLTQLFLAVSWEGFLSNLWLPAVSCAVSVAIMVPYFIKEARRVPSVCYQGSLIYCNVIIGVTFHRLCWFNWLEAVSGSARIKRNRSTQRREQQIMECRRGKHLLSTLIATVGEKNKELINLGNKNDHYGLPLIM